MSLWERMFWNKRYTRAELMRESRWLLLLIVVVNLILAWMVWRNGTLENPQEELIWMGGVTLIYLIAALLEHFWLRFICLFVWMGDLYVSVATGQIPQTAIAVVLVGVIFLYKMFKYRNVGVDRADFLQ